MVFTGTQWHTKDIQKNIWMMKNGQKIINWECGKENLLGQRNGEEKLNNL